VAHQLASYESRLIRGLGLTPKQAQAFLEKAIPVIALGDVTGFEASDAFFQRPWFGSGTRGATAAELAQVQVFNPLGSGVDVILELAVISPQTTQDVQFRVDTVALATLTTDRSFRDRRITGNPANEIRTRSDAAALGTFIGLANVGASPSEAIPLDILLPPGQGFNLNGTVVNNTLQVLFYGFEQNRE